MCVRAIRVKLVGLCFAIFAFLSVPVWFSVDYLVFRKFAST